MKTRLTSDLEACLSDHRFTFLHLTFSVGWTSAPATGDIRVTLLQQFERTARDSFVFRDNNAVAQIRSVNHARDVPMPVANIRDVTLLGTGNALGLWSAAAGECAIVRYRDGYGIWKTN